MLKLISTTMFSSLFFSAIQGQIQYKLPSNVSVQRDYSENEIKASGDLDLDGISDLVVWAGSDDAENKLFVFTSKAYKANGSFQTISYPFESLELNVEKGALEIKNNGCMGRCELVLKFEFNSSLNDLNLIYLQNSHLPSLYGTEMQDKGYNNEYDFKTGLEHRNSLQQLLLRKHSMLFGRALTSNRLTNKVV